MMGDAVYQPDPGAEVQDDAGQLEPEDTLDNRGVGDVLDEGYSPPDRPPPIYRTGITARDEFRGESLDERLAEELPDPPVPDGDDVGDASDTDGEILDEEVGAGRAGRLVAPGEGSHDERDGMIASDVGIDGAAASAEEAAVHVVADQE
ncbi:hypothetical protein GXW82_18260 [Streptacidiphilus sp. 4-A2]|nr:hypothetical protein [Streptacidiphilus sp. 4-A2]